ncbi:hypothetical protein ABZX88_12465 [Kitasatospora aureofaciens]|uniref:hypothetical protein n=1 Tax=Kitasatospora aureofaciens TaxID=1894 RepID=UPI0033B5237A
MRSIPPIQLASGATCSTSPSSRHWAIRSCSSAARSHVGGDGPAREDCDPLTGRGRNSTDFSWSAALLLPLLRL